MHKKLSLLLLILLAFNLQSQTYNFKNYTDEDGLPQSYVYCVSQSNKGFLYLSTGDGFCKFDGNNFKTFTTRDNLSENFINTHFTDSRNITWIGHFQNGVSYLTGNTFYKVKNSEKLETKVNALAEDNAKNIWVVAQQKGLYKIDTAFKFSQVQIPLQSNINAVYFDLDGEMLTATDEGLFLLKTNQKTVSTVCAVKGFEDKKIQCIVPCDTLRNSFWVAVPGEGVYKILKAGSCYYIYTKVVSELGSVSMNISTLYVDRTHNLWVSLLGEGLRKISFNSLEVNNVLFINKQNGLSNEYIQTIFQDFEDNMWFGTSGGGLIEMPINKFNYFTSQGNVKSVVVDNNKGTIYTGNDKGLFVLMLKEQSKSVLYNKDNGFVNDQVNALMKDSAGNIWIGTSENGVFIFNPITNKFENFSKNHNLKSLDINNIIETKHSHVVIATTDGVYYYNKKENVVTLFTTLDLLLHNNVQQLFIDSKSRMWISSHGAPPYYIKNEEPTVLKSIPDMKFFNINSVTEDNNSLIWIATEGDGVYSYDGSEFKKYKLDDGLLSNFGYFITADENNTIWVGHKNGLSKKEDGQTSFQKFTKADGLLFPENNVNACYKDDKNNLWFGTNTGLVHYDCKTNKINTHEPRTSILGINLNNHFYATSENISMPYQHYSARIDFIGISLVDPTKVTYKYRMLGLDTIWRYTSNRYVEFPRVSEGVYTFQLMACNNDGIWNINPAEIKFEIDLPIWKKPWFYIVSSLFLIVLVYFIINWRTKKLVQTSIRLEKMVDEKTHLLKEEKELVEQVKIQLEEKNKDVTDSINYAKRIQEAILPAREAVTNAFPQSFILYRPKDIVSGDFYWAFEQQNKIYFMCADCTGHGVPGAFMSLLGINFLNEIVIEKKITQPDLVLNELRREIIQSLNQQGGEETKDGMDGTFCCIDTNALEIQIAAANNPVWIIQPPTNAMQTTEDGVLKLSPGFKFTEINSDKMPIGKSPKDDTLFSLKNYKLKKGDCIFMFSDGFADQFGGPKGKKFKYKMLKETIFKNCHLPMHEQKQALQQCFTEWKAGFEQVDDVLIIGIKV